MWIVALLVGSGFFLFLELYLFPKLFLRIGAFVSVKSDRGISKRETEDGKHYIYTPSGKAGSYIFSYYLQQGTDGLHLKCKIDESLSYLDYNIVLFNANNKIFRVMNVCEKIEVAGYTQEIVLPPEATYVALHVNYADNEKVDASVFHVPVKKLILFAVLSALTIGLQVFWVRGCLALFYHDVFSFSFLFSNVNILYVALAIVIGIVLYLSSAFVALSIKIKKFRKKGA